MIDNRDPEKCYYCDNKAEYTQLVGDTPLDYTMANVCKKHFQMDLTS